MATANTLCGGLPPPRKMTDYSVEESRCAVCQQSNCDIQIISCGCLLHTTCLPLDILFMKHPMRVNYGTQQAFCPCCHRSPVVQIRVLPLPMTVLEEAARLRDMDNEALAISHSESSMASGSPMNSIALSNGTNKRNFMAKSSNNRAYRTGRWTSEESAYTDKLIKAFDAGQLPLPHGIKLNDFLCELLSCRTSRLTKKLKNAKLSARTYRSWASGYMGGYPALNVGGDIQRAQTLFLKIIAPEWVRMELQFNISRMWRTHLANFCLQISYLQLNTKEWFGSLDAIDYVTVSCEDNKLDARRKRMRTALTEDGHAAARTEDTSTNSSDATPGDRDGVFVGGLPFQRLSSLNLQALAGDEEKPSSLGVNTDEEDKTLLYRERIDNLNGSISKEASAKLTSSRKFSFDSTGQASMKHSTSLSSFVDLFSPETPASKPPSRKPSSIDLNDFATDGADKQKNDQLDTSTSGYRKRSGSVVDNIIDEAIDSVLVSTSPGKEYQGLFLREVSKFLASSDSPFQHVDLWVPMDVSQADNGENHIGDSSAFATNSSKNVTGIIYGGGQEHSVRLSNAGFITVQASTKIVNTLNEFGMYSKNFSFSPGFGLPGRTFLSRIPSWERNITTLKPDQFARVGGAKIYGLNTAFSVPVYTPIGVMVVCLYSTKNLNRDMMYERKCMEFFSKLKPEPKWKLTIEVGMKASPDDPEDPNGQSDNPSPRLTSVKSEAYVIPPSPTSSKDSRLLKLPSTSNENVASNTPAAVAPEQWNEQSLAVLIGKYMPLDRDSSPNTESHDVASNLMALRLLLLRSPSSQSIQDSNLVSAIMDKYHNCLRSGKKEHETIISVLSEWKRLTTQPTNRQTCTSNFGIVGNSPMPSPAINPFIPNAGANFAHNAPANFSLDNLQSMATIASAVAGLSTPHYQMGDPNNVPRVVSEQGRIGADG